MAADGLETFGVELLFELVGRELVGAGEFDVLNPKVANPVERRGNVLRELISKTVELQADWPFEAYAGAGCGLQQSEVCQPVLETCVPDSKGDSVARLDAAAMPTVCVDVQVSRLRQRLGDDAREPVIIKTVRGEGYVLAASVEKGEGPLRA